MVVPLKKVNKMNNNLMEKQNQIINFDAPGILRAYGNIKGLGEY